MVKKKQSIVKYDRFIGGFELVNDMMLTRLLVAKAESGDYSLDDKQFYDKLRAVAIEENNNYARPFAAATAWEQVAEAGARDTPTETRSSYASRRKMACSRTGRSGTVKSDFVRPDQTRCRRRRKS